MFENDKQQWCKRKYWLLLALILPLLLTYISSVSATTITAATIQIFPNEGDITTKIIVQVRGEPYSPSSLWGNYVTDKADYPRLYLKYDNIIIVQRMACITAPGDGSYSYYYCSWDYNFSIQEIQQLNKYPYSNLGTHIINATIEASDGTTASATATFTIVNYLPPVDLFWTWWNSLNSTIKSQLQGPQGIQGPKGDTGATGPQGQYPTEVLILNLGISTLSVIISIITLRKVQKSVKMQ